MSVSAFHAAARHENQYHKQRRKTTMPVEWIILVAVLLLAGVAGCIIVHRYDGFQAREKALQVKASEESERRIAAAKEYERRGVEAERKQPDIPVWRDKPKDQK